MRDLNTPLRDSEYYFKDGDCEICVENTLFRIHKFPLTQNSSAFSDKFIVGNISGNDFRIQLPDDDTSEEFRALCWALYHAPPDVTQALAVKETLPNEDISRLLSLVLISHKYSYTSFENWAKNILRAHCLKGFPDICSAHDTKRLVRYYTLVEDAQILDVIHKAILKSLDAEKPELGPWLRKRNITRSTGAIFRPLDIVEMLYLGETNGWRELQGSVYYRLLCDAVPQTPLEVILNPSLSIRQPILSGSVLLSAFPKSLSLQQKSNLLQGFISITAVWDSLIQEGFSNLLNNCSCFLVRCHGPKELVWNKILADASKSFTVVDILERLAHMRSRLVTAMEHHKVTRHCQPKLTAFLDAIEEGIESSIADYFLGDGKGIRTTIYSKDQAAC